MERKRKRPIPIQYIYSLPYKLIEEDVRQGKKRRCRCRPTAVSSPSVHLSHLSIRLRAFIPFYFISFRVLMGRERIKEWKWRSPLLLPVAKDVDVMRWTPQEETRCLRNRQTRRRRVDQKDNFFEWSSKNKSISSIHSTQRNLWRHLMMTWFVRNPHIDAICLRRD